MRKRILLIFNGGKIKMEKYDFSGWATRNDIRCSDGRTIRRDAFIENDGKIVPLVWNHQHDDSLNVLGHALLENRPDGVYAYGTFNDTEAGKNAKLLVKHGDVCALSIYANKLKQNGGDVIHGAIREVSLVLAGANPGAFIDSVMYHGEESEEDAYITFIDEDSLELNHEEKYEENVKSKEKENNEMADNINTNTNVDDKTVKDVFDELTEEQKQVVYFLIGQALEDAGVSDDENTEDEDNNEGEEMKHNIFEGGYQGEVLSHSEMNAIFSDAKRYGSLKEAVLEHGITNIDYMFPDAQMIGNAPDFIKREDAWVSKVMSGTHHTPFAKIKSIHANITEADARALGFTKGNVKKDEVFALLKRQTNPTTIYKKQKLDRDDMVDITDFDVVAWLKSEMRMMLDEEIARAILIGDGRSTSSDDKISELCIRPVWTDDDLYTIKQTVSVSSTATESEIAKEFIRQAIKSRKAYKGSGNPVLFTTEDVLTDCLLIEDTTGRVIYDTIEKLKNALRVSDIITVPVMEGKTRTGDDSETRTLMGLILNIGDYNVGADKGGEVNMFDDFDIDYNAQKYLIETRCSGALVKPYSAIALESVVAGD